MIFLSNMQIYYEFATCSSKSGAISVRHRTTMISNARTDLAIATVWNLKTYRVFSQSVHFPYQMTKYRTTWKVIYYNNTKLVVINGLLHFVMFIGYILNLKSNFGCILSIGLACCNFRLLNKSFDSIVKCRQVKCRDCMECYCYGNHVNYGLYWTCWHYAKCYDMLEIASQVIFISIEGHWHYCANYYLALMLNCII